MESKSEEVKAQTEEIKKEEVLEQQSTKETQIQNNPNLINTKAQLLQDSKQEQEIVKKVYEWAIALMQKEKLRLKDLGVEPIDLEVIDMSVLVEGKKRQLNRVIFNAEIDFEKVTNILISSSIPCDFRPGYQYVNVVLYISGKEIPIIFPYVYKTRLRSQAGKNNLKHWVFINNKFKESYHLVNSFETIK